MSSKPSEGEDPPSSTILFNPNALMNSQQAPSGRTGSHGAPTLFDDIPVIRDQDDDLPEDLLNNLRSLHMDEDDDDDDELPVKRGGTAIFGGSSGSPRDAGAGVQLGGESPATLGVGGTASDDLLAHIMRNLSQANAGGTPTPNWGTPQPTDRNNVSSRLGQTLNATQSSLVNTLAHPQLDQSLSSTQVARAQHGGVPQSPQNNAMFQRHPSFGQHNHINNSSAMMMSNSPGKPLVEPGHSSSANYTILGGVNLIIAGIPGGARIPDVRRLFEPYGTVRSAMVKRRPGTGASEGYGFVLMAHREDAQRAIAALDQSLFMESHVAVHFADQEGEGIETNEIFMRNVPRGVTQTDVSHFIEAKLGGTGFANQIENVKVEADLTHATFKHRHGRGGGGEMGPSPPQLPNEVPSTAIVSFKTIDGARTAVEEIDGLLVSECFPWVAADQSKVMVSEGGFHSNQHQLQHHTPNVQQLHMQQQHPFTTTHIVPVRLMVKFQEGHEARHRRKHQKAALQQRHQMANHQQHQQQGHHHQQQQFAAVGLPSSGTSSPSLSRTASGIPKNNLSRHNSGLPARNGGENSRSNNLNSSGIDAQMVLLQMQQQQLLAMQMQQQFQPQQPPPKTVVGTSSLSSFISNAHTVPVTRSKDVQQPQQQPQTLASGTFFVQSGATNAAQHQQLLPVMLQQQQLQALTPQQQQQLLLQQMLAQQQQGWAPTPQ